MLETLGNLGAGFSVALSPPILFYAFVGCVIGTLVGVLPGVGPLARPPIEGAAAVARQLAAAGGRFAVFARPAIVNGGPGIIVGPHFRKLLAQLEALGTRPCQCGSASRW